MDRSGSTAWRGLYLAASRGLRARKSSRALAVFGALTIIAFAVPMLPVLFSRAPILFRIPAVIYLLLSIIILVGSAKAERSEVDKPDR